MSRKRFRNPKPSVEPAAEPPPPVERRANRHDQQMQDIVLRRRQKLEAERAEHFRRTPASKAAFDAADHLFGRVPMISQVALSMLDQIPKFGAAFTNLTEEEVSKLEFDDLMMVVGGIFLLNYRFFTVQIPPILKAFMRSLGIRQSLIESVKPTTNPAAPRALVKRRK